MGLQPKLQRPEWWRTLNAGRELLDPGVFASYKDDLSWKDLSGLKLSKTRYYCSVYAKNDHRLTNEYNYHRDINAKPIGPYNNVPWRVVEQYGWRKFRVYDTQLISQNEPLKGIYGETHQAPIRNHLNRPGFTYRVFTQYQTNDTLKRPHKLDDKYHRWSFCEPNGVLKPVWQNFNLSNSSLQSADLRYIDLSSANLTGIISGGVIANSDTKLPRDWIESGGFLLGPTADLRHQDLSGISIQNIDLSIPLI